MLAFPTADDFGGKSRGAKKRGAVSEPGYDLGAPTGHAESAAVVVGERLCGDAHMTTSSQVRIAFPRPVEARYLQVEWLDNYGKYFTAMDSLDLVGTACVPPSTNANGHAGLPV